jgi:catechol 2,3-dioxygenase
MDEPIYDIAHLAHVELLTPKLDESVFFFVEVMGMIVSDRRGDSVYLRGWDDYEHHSLKLTAAEIPMLGHYAWRASSPQALQRRVAALERSTLGHGWSDGDVGHGPAYRFTDPDGHKMEIYYETEWYSPPPELRPALKNQALDFWTRCKLTQARSYQLACCRCAPTGSLCRVFGMRLTEQIIFDDGSKASWLDPTTRPTNWLFRRYVWGESRLHHITYAVDSREDVLRTADVCLEHGVFIETDRINMRSRTFSLCIRAGISF